MDDVITIQKTTVERGQQAHIKLAVGRLPSSTGIYIHLHVYRSIHPGPTMLVLGGVHGDEINGVEIVRRAVSGGMFKELQLGSVIAIPLLNVYGFINFSRDLPDGKDVNRSFPGNLRGSLASRVARQLTKKVLPHVDFGIDFHTGGRSISNYPQVRYTKGDRRAEEMARLFDAPVMIAYKTIRKSLRRAGKDNNIPILVYEAGENLRFDGQAIDEGLDGLRRLLIGHGMLEGTLSQPKSHEFKKSTWLRASKAGIFRWFIPSGNWVQKGDPLGVINDPYGTDETPVLARLDGFIIGHNNSPVINTGDALFHIAY